jgi:hypothetical protein
MIETVDSVGPEGPPADRHRGMLVTDLDGTLLGSDRALSEVDRDALERLGADGYLRVVATGRNPYSFGRAAGPSFPIDYAVLSSGAAVRVHPSGHYLRTVAMEPHEVWPAAAVLLRMDIDFMIHDPLPDNHTFACHPGTRSTPDYRRRIEIYEPYARPLAAAGQDTGDLQASLPVVWPGGASQLLAIEPPGSERDVYNAVRRQLGGYTVLRSTSPLGTGATWVEIYPARVSKSQAARWLAARLGIDQTRVLCVGNDYNDLDLLEWGAASYVVANAPEDLRARFEVVPSNDQGGVAESIRRWRIRG